ncbi:MAG: ankyrin repeat domain-containing protein [Pyrinomonadaceae bacterium]
MFIRLSSMVLAVIVSFQVGTGQSVSKGTKLDRDSCAKGSPELSLLIAISNDDQKCAEGLLKAGLDPNFTLENKPNSFPLLLAVAEERSEIVTLLLKSGVDLKRSESVAAFILSIKFGSSSSINKFLEAGIDVNSSTEDKTSVLMMAAFYGNFELVTKLILKGGSLNSFNAKGVNSMMIAADNPDVVNKLIKAGIDIEFRDLEGRTAVFYAIEGIQLSKLEILIERGVKFDLKDKNGVAPISLARKISDDAKREQVFSILRKYGVSLSN